jgi:spermidine/putrescine transport system permease protein
MMKKILGSAWLGIVLLFMYFPIVILAVYSFMDTPTIGTSGHFSLQNYVKLFTTPELTEMIMGTLSLAFKCAVIATILGTMGAIGAFYSRKGMRGFVVAANQIPIVNADVVTGFSICVLLIVVLAWIKVPYGPGSSVLWGWRHPLSIFPWSPN